MLTKEELIILRMYTILDEINEIEIDKELCDGIYEVVEKLEILNREKDKLLLSFEQLLENLLDILKKN